MPPTEGADVNIDVLKFIETGGTVAILVGILFYMFTPMMKMLATIQLSIQRNNDLIDTLIVSVKETKASLQKNACDTHLLRQATMIAYSGRAEGGTWAQAQDHYKAAASLLADADSIELLREFEEKDKDYE
jgi:hypothetical protein